MRAKQLPLYLLILFLGSALLVVGLGGGFFNQQGAWPAQWQHQAFFNLCHQIPERSFWINGQPMAVCSRCIGIYAGFTIGWLVLPLWSFAKESARLQFVKVASAVLVINFIDIVGNILGFWENTLVSRLAFGCMLGLSAALIFSGDFFKTNIQSKGNHHGRLTESKLRTW